MNTKLLFAGPRFSLRDLPLIIIINIIIIIQYLFQLTNAIKHSLEQSDGLPKDGPLGLEMCMTDAQDTKPINGKTVSANFQGPAVYYSDGESYESCLETIDNDNDDDVGEVYADTVDSFDDKSDSKYLSTWL